MNSKSTPVGVLVLGMLLAAASPALAEKLTMKVSLNAAASVPPNNSPGTGTADVTFDTATKLLTWKVTYSGLTGPATMAHFHGPAEADKNAGVAVPIPNPASGADGSATLTDAQAADLLAGKYYINIHTDANKGGEIRGQVTR
jgi:CHRD domain